MKRTVLGSVALWILTVALIAPVAGAQTLWIQYGILNKADSQQCMTLPTEAKPGTAAVRIGLQACAVDGVHGGQAWGWIKVDRKSRSGADTYAFQNVVSQTCIAVERGSGSNKAKLVGARCDLNDPAQLWTRSSQLRPGTSTAGMTKWVNLKSRKCIDVGDTSELRQWTCQWSGPYWPQEFVAP